ncbi:monocarboxylate transporter 13-like [Asterias rubens]|uniref:monocarboxylate transporter 13-like n=1 Tax=Asterias rubens TaxID=7604 RepID=UPI0014555589|nr:monocarboxylate transporter 13-like [Asterias rubens]XP_033645424.1 monocarboxylate transporter 13-like [Asterias rubens]
MVRQGKQQRLRESSASLDFEPPDGGWGWLVALGAFTEMFLTMGTLLCSGVYFSPLQHEFEMSAAELGWVISSGSTLLSATCPIGSVCVKKFGCRTTALIGGIAVSGGFIASSFAQSSINIFITLGLITGIGSGLVFVSAAVILGHYFKKRYAIVNGLAFSGPGLAIFICPPLLDYLVDTYGWRGSFLIQGAFAMHTVAAAALFRPVRLRRLEKLNDLEQTRLARYTRIDENEAEEENEHHESCDVIENSAGETSDVNGGGVCNGTAIPCVSSRCPLLDIPDATTKSTESLSIHTEVQVHAVVPNGDCCEQNIKPIDSLELRALNDLEVTSDHSQEISAHIDQSKRKKRFSIDRLSVRINRWLLYVGAVVLVCPVSFFQACAFYSVTSHVVARTSLVGVNAQMAGMALSSLGAGSTFTRLTHGFFIHRGLVSATTAYIIALVLGVIGAFGQAIATTYVGVIVASLTIGFSSGSVYPLVPVVLRDLVSLRGLPTSYGLAMFFDSCGVFAGGFTAGLLRDVTGSYTASFCMTGAFYVMATIFLLLVPLIQRMHRRRAKSELDQNSNVSKGDAEPA